MLHCLLRLLLKLQMRFPDAVALPPFLKAAPPTAAQEGDTCEVPADAGKELADTADTVPADTAPASPRERCASSASPSASWLRLSSVEAWRACSRLAATAAAHRVASPAQEVQVRRD